MPPWSAAQLLATKRLFSAIAASASAPSGRKIGSFLSSLHDALLSRSMHALPSHGAHFAQRTMLGGRGSENNSLGKAAKSWSAKLLSNIRKEPAGGRSLLTAGLLARGAKDGVGSAPVRTFFQQGYYRPHSGGVKTSLTMATPQSMSTAATAGLTGLVNGGPVAQKRVAYWLFGSAGWVFSMVVLGGVTRLTRSGLSMTDWRFAGGLPPLTEEEWEVEFNKYKQSPEYKK